MIEQKMGLSAVVRLTRKGRYISPEIIREFVDYEDDDELLTKSNIGIDGSYVKIRTNPSHNLPTMKTEYQNLLSDLEKFCKSKSIDAEVKYFDIHIDGQIGLGPQMITWYLLQKDFPIHSFAHFPILPTSYGIEIRELCPKIMQNKSEFTNLLIEVKSRIGRAT